MMKSRRLRITKPKRKESEEYAVKGYECSSEKKLKVMKWNEL